MNKYNDWTLFLDRDGVINQRIPSSYVKNIAEFHFLPKALDALRELALLFPRIVVVTNQQGIGKGLMTDEDLKLVHQFMQEVTMKAGGRIDMVYYCPKLATENPECRKPNPGMAHQAQSDFPAIDFKKSIIVGDSISDMEFGLNLSMKTAYVATKEEELEAGKELKVDYRVKSLFEFWEKLDMEIISH